MDSTNKKIYFSVDTIAVIDNILTRYHLQQNDEELTEKMSKEEPFFINNGVVLDTAIALAKKEMADADAISSLQKDLNINQSIAQSILNDIKRELVSFTSTEKPKEVPEQKTRENNSHLEQRKKETYNKPPINLTEKLKTPPEIILEDDKNLKDPLETQKPKKALPKKTIIEKSSQPKRTGKDTYREPIE